MIYHVQGEHDNCYTLAAVYKNNYKAKNNKLILKLLKTNYLLRRVWRYQRGNQNPCVEERQKTTMVKKKKDKH